MKREFVSAEVADHVAVATMHRPPVNAVNQQFLEELTLVFDELAVDDDVHAVILTGQGQVFCAGADLKESSRGVSAAADLHRSRVATEAFFTIHGCKKPTIAAINGPALGAGLALVASCDILIAAENAYLALPEVGVGVVGGAKHAMRLLGHSLTRRMLLAGYRASAEELYRVGVIEKSVPKERLIAEAREIALEIASKDATVVQDAKRALNYTEDMTLRDGYAYEQALTIDLLANTRRHFPGNQG